MGEQPNVKDEAGPHFWYVLERIVNKIPDNPSRADIRKATRTMDEVANSYPCDDCVDNYAKYKKEHPLKCTTRDECAAYLCEFHNDIRKRQGKEVKDCKATEECTDCKGSRNKDHGHDDKDVEPTNDAAPSKNVGGPQMGSPQEVAAVRSFGLDNDGIDSEVPGLEHKVDTDFSRVAPNVHHAFDVQLPKQKIMSGSHKPTTLDELKNVSRRIIEEMCRKEGIPIPEIIFRACPSNKKTSCTRVPVDMEGNLLKDKPTKIFLDPNSYSPRSIVHEGAHYIAKYKGDETLFRDEIAIDNIARTAIEAGFTEAEVDPISPLPGGIPMPSEMGQIAHDIFSEGPNWLVNSFKERSEGRLAEWKRNFPTFSKLFSPAVDSAPSQALPPPAVDTAPQPMVRADPPPEIPQGTRYTDGFLSFIDPVMAPVAKITGLHPRDVTESHIPNLLGNVMMTIVESNLNDFGSLLISAGSAGLTLLIGILAKDQLGMGDKKFLMGMGGNLLWNSMRYIVNPKISKHVFSDAQQFGKAVSIMDLDGMAYTMSYDAEVMKKLPPGTNMHNPESLSPVQVRALQKNAGFQQDVPAQNTYPIQGASTGGIGKPYGGQAVAGADNMPYGHHGGVRPFGNLDSEFDEFSLEEQNRIGRAQRAAFSPAVA